MLEALCVVHVVESRVFYSMMMMIMMMIIMI